jgi:general secretion pathway protein B
MSFILDALKKSESERHRAVVPGLAPAAIVRRESRLPVVLAVVAALLLVNGAILYFLLKRDGTPAAVTPATTPAATARTTAAAPAIPAPARLTAPVRPLGAEPAAAENARDSREALEPPPLERAPRVAARELPERAPGGASGELPPGLAALPQPAGLPPLRVDLHVYTSDAGARFAVINGHRYKEGELLTEGPRVETITPEGVVLAFHGSRFLLRRD